MFMIVMIVWIMIDYKINDVTKSVKIDLVELVKFESVVY